MTDGSNPDTISPNEPSADPAPGEDDAGPTVTQSSPTDRRRKARRRNRELDRRRSGGGISDFVGWGLTDAIAGFVRKHPAIMSVLLALLLLGWVLFAVGVCQGG